MKIAILALLACVGLQAQTYKNTKASPDERAKDVLSKMTLEEKIDYMGGYKDFYIRGIERLGLPEIKMTDGPVGTRNYGNTTAYPATVLSAASWDKNLSYEFGKALGKDARERGVHILLAPGVNIYRAPMNGRNFEYLGEDPYLSGTMAVQYIKGVQEQGVVATVKHFAANNQEWDRNNVSSDMGERTLREIYLPAFKMAVQKGKVGAVMNSYNLVNGAHATQNEHLNNDILKGEWKFDGILMSDWDATYDGVAAAKNGLDLEMPSGKFMNRATLLPAIKSGELSEKVIDDHVLRILRTIFRFGFYDTGYAMASELKDNVQNAKVALDIARGGMVLLKNDNILPLSKKVRSVAVIGPNADHYVAGGGSSYTHPFHFVSLVDGIRKIVPSAQVNLVKNALPTLETYVETTPFYLAKGSSEKGLKADYFANKNLEGNPVASVVDKKPDHNWNGKPEVGNVPEDNFSIRFTGVVRPAASGTYTFGVRGDDGYRLWVNGVEILNEWSDHGALLRLKNMPLEAGKDYEVKLEFYENGGGASIAFAVYQEHIDFADAVKAAKSSDVAIVSIGFDSNSESEGFDRSFELPAYQADLVKAVAEANPNTVVVLNAGGNVYMQNWLSSAKGLLHAWYPGQEGGTAAAEILFGDVNPSGKLPASFEKEWKDNPTYANYYDDDKDKHVHYDEGLDVGYRYYDKGKTKPQFPFGFGLSYTKFEYSNIKIENKGVDEVIVSFDIKNIGSRDGAEVAQVYVSQEKTPEDRPLKELKGFSKVFLKKGETKKVTLALDRDAFSYYKVEQHKFGYDAGRFQILVGSSSQDIKLKAATEIR